MTKEALKHLKAITEAFGPDAGIELDQKAWAKLHTAIKEALAQQEPVKWSDYEPDGMHHNKPQKRPQNCGTGYCSCIECVMETPQRTWVGLTDEEYKDLHLQMGPVYYYQEYGQAIEAKLKEKNT